MKKKFFNQFYLMNGLSKNRRLTFDGMSPSSNQNEVDEIQVQGLTPPASRKELLEQKSALEK